MKTEFVGRMILGPILFFAGGVGLSFLALFCVIAESGESSSSLGCAVAVYSAYWPSMLVGIKKEMLLGSVWNILLNALGWGLVGFVGVCLWPLSGRHGAK